MFSTMAQMPTALTFAFRAASERMTPKTAAAPAMSYFISSMPPAGLMEMPPVSKVTPLPTKAMGAPPPLPAPCHCRATSCGSWLLPWATPSMALRPSLRSFSRPRTSTFKPSLVSALAAAAKLAG